jgi:hypothetical protein
MGGVKMVAAMLPEETPTQKLNKGYFNANESTQRISGNPATDLYAGMNRNSAFGNLETAGANRIAKREKTAATKNVSDKFKADTEKMKEQQKDYKAQKTATQKLLKVLQVEQLQVEVEVDQIAEELYVQTYTEQENYLLEIG